MAKFISTRFTHNNEEVDKDERSFLNLEKIAYVDFKCYTVYTTESKTSPDSTNNKYVFSADHPAWKAVVQYVEENMYQGQKKEGEL